MKINRRKTKIIKIGNLLIGGNNPVAIQSMAKIPTSDVRGTLREIRELERSGCEIVRLAVKDNRDIAALKKIRKGVKLPLVADIHFDWRLALGAIENGVDKIRLNPGNIYKQNQIREIARSAKLNGIPIRVGVNSGSIRGHKSQVTSHKSGGIAGSMVKSALDYIRILERFGFYEIVVSLKGSNIFDTIEAYRKIAKLCDYPLHLGTTATGAPYSGVVKSSIALGALLLEGIGDTLRVSLTDNPAQEVRVARVILEALCLRSFSPQIISCPTCGRCEVDLVKIVRDLESKLSTMDFEPLTKPLTLAVMGCVVNGPQEAKVADIGVAFGKNQGLLFRNSRPLRKVSYAGCVSALLDEVSKLRGN